jgi:hypothetical protein
MNMVFATPIPPTSSATPARPSSSAEKLFWLVLVVASGGMP